MSKLLNYAIEKESEGLFIDALNYYEMVMEEKGCPFDIRKDIGRVLNKMGQYEDALSCFDLVLTMDEKHAECYFGKGISCICLGNWLDAYNFFVKAHKFGFNENANNWYFLSILGSVVGVDKKNVKQFYEYFKQMDNEEFARERSQYRFGLYFYHIENQLKNSTKKLNIEEFVNEFKKYGLTEEEIFSYLKTLSYEGLIEKIKEIKRQHQINVEKHIINNELIKMGLSDDDIKDIFEIESLDNLKEQVISSNPNISFPEVDISVDIPLYYKSPLAKFIDKYATEDYQRIKNVSKFNEFCSIMPPINRSNFIRIIGTYSNSHSYQKNKSKANKFFNLSREFFENENFKDGYYYLMMALEFCPSDYYNIINMKFYLACFFSKLKGFESKYNAYKQFSYLIKFVGHFNSNIDIFVLNMANLCYDLSFYDPSFVDLAIDNYYNYLKSYPDNEEVIYLLRSLMNFKSTFNDV